MSEPLSSYVPRAAESAWTGPSVFLDATVCVFAVKVDLECIGELISTYVARPSHELGLPLDVRATNIPYAFFVFVDGKRGQPPRGGEPCDDGLEGVHDTKLFAVVVPVLQCHPIEKLQLFAPYLYTSACPGWCADREIYGLPQQQGSVDTVPDDDGFPRRIALVARAIERFAPNAVASDATLLTLTRRQAFTQATASRDASTNLAVLCARALNIGEVRESGSRMPRAARRPWVGVTAGDGAFLARSSAPFKERRPPGPGKHELLELLAGPMSMLFLKQFRDIVFADRACYQAIVEATLRGTDDVPLTELGPYELHCQAIDSAPIARELGIPHSPVPVDFACMLRVPCFSLADPKVLSNPAWNPAVELSLPDVPSRLPPYVERGGESVWRHPSRLVGARIYGFGIEVHVDRQSETLDRYINNQSIASMHVGSLAGPESTPFRLRCAGLGIVLFLFVDYRQITSGTDDDEPLGSVSYREFLVMQLAERGDADAPVLDWFIPAIYLDADAPRLGGREIYGYPKQLGDIDIDLFGDGSATSALPRRLELSALVMSDTNGRHVTHQPIVTIEGPSDPPRVDRQYTDSSQMFLDLFRECGDDEARQQVLGALVPRSLRGVPLTDDVRLQNALALSNIGNVFLKEFRDCIDPSEACYKAVCRTDTVPGVFQSGGRLDPSDYTIQVRPHASERLHELLDPLTSQKPMNAKFAYVLDLDFTLSRGRVMANALAAPFVPDVSSSTSSVVEQPDAVRPQPAAAPAAWTS